MNAFKEKTDYSKTVTQLITITVCLLLFSNFSTACITSLNQQDEQSINLEIKASFKNKRCQTVYATEKNIFLS